MLQQQPGVVPPSSCLATSGCSLDSAGGNTLAGVSTEYMVKPSSQEGLKLTINKTGSNKSSSSGSGSISSSSTGGQGKSKSSSGGVSSSSGSSGSTKKQHTGLKPGVNSGPASKKATAAASAAASSSSSKHLFQKANSSGNLSTKLSGSSAGGGVPLTKSNSTNSFQEHNAPRRRPSMGGLGTVSGGGNSSQRKSSNTVVGLGGSSGAVSPAAHGGSTSQPPPRFDHHTDMMTILQYASPTMAASMEGFIKGLHNKFQIPKLSQRGSGTNPPSGRSTPSADQLPTTTSASTTSATVPSSGVQDPEAKPPAPHPSPGGNDGLLNLSSTAAVPSGDGIDEELLASLAGE